MASVEAMAAAEVPDGSTQHTQPTQIPVASSLPTEVNVGNRQTTDVTPARSLFGPFPSLEDRNRADQHTLDSTEATPAPVSPSTDQIGLSGEDQRPVNPTNTNLNAHGQESLSPAQVKKPDSPNSPSAPPLTREKTVPAIGPATDKPTPLPKESETEGPVLYITLLLSSSGARHPYKLDAKYLRKRNVVVDGNNPINISLYKLKELILRDWREGENKYLLMRSCRSRGYTLDSLTFHRVEWEAKPSSPESIRLISMGKLLNDKARLSGKPCFASFSDP